MQQALVLSNKILTEEDISDVLEFHLNGKKMNIFCSIGDINIVAVYNFCKKFNAPFEIFYNGDIDILNAFNFNKVFIFGTKSLYTLVTKYRKKRGVVWIER